MGDGWRTRPMSRDRSEVYVQAFPSPGTRSQISTGRWQRSHMAARWEGALLSVPDGRLMALTVKADASFTVEPATRIVQDAHRRARGPDGSVTTAHRMYPPAMASVS